MTKRTRMPSHVLLSKMSARRFRIAPAAYIAIYAAECKVTKRLATAYKPRNASINSTWKYANTHKLYNHIVINGRNVVKFSACRPFWLCRYCRDSYTRARFDALARANWLTNVAACQSVTNGSRQVTDGWTDGQTYRHLHHGKDDLDDIELASVAIGFMRSTKDTILNQQTT